MKIHILQICGKHVSLYAITYETLLFVSSFNLGMVELQLDNNPTKNENVCAQKIPYKGNTIRHICEAKAEKKKKFTIIMYYNDK